MSTHAFWMKSDLILYFKLEIGIKLIEKVREMC